MTRGADIELEFYERFFIERGIEPYPVQEKACTHILAGESVLATVPTGTGKTLMAKAGILRALRTKKTAIYTTPLRALTEEKYRELSEDFGAENVGFATGDYKVNPEAPIQVLVAEILWNRIYGSQVTRPADIVIMDEGHYFNDYERGYVWEQSIIGLHPDTQLVILSATIGYPDQFCQWVYLTRRVPMQLVRSMDRKVPLYHEYKESYLVETVKELYAAGDYPAIIFTFGRALCFERARLLRSCPRFVDKDEQARIEEAADKVLLAGGEGPELKKILLHGIGVHHAGVLPAYRRLVEELTSLRLLKFVVTTETIAAGINLPAKRVVFPSLRKFIRGKARLLLPAEYHQMAGRAGRPQFDTEGIAVTLGPEEVIQEFRKEIRDLEKRGVHTDEARIKKKYYQRAKADAKAKGDVTWDEEAHQKIVQGQPAALISQTKITAEQILAIGLPDLTVETLPGLSILEAERRAAEARAEEARAAEERAATKGGAAEMVAPPAESEEEAAEESGAATEAPPDASFDLSSVEPVYRRIDIRTVIDNLLLPSPDRREAHKRLAQITANLQALGVLDAHGRQIAGEVIGKIRGMDGPFVWYCLTEHELSFEELRELVELLVDHDVIHRVLTKKDVEARRHWILNRLREKRRENPLVTFEDCEAEYWEEHPPELTRTEHIHAAFAAKIPHPELHGGKIAKSIWAQMEDGNMSFLEFVEAHDLAQEEGSLFTYLARVMKAARMLHEVTGIAGLELIESRVRAKLAAVDERVLEGLW